MAKALLVVSEERTVAYLDARGQHELVVLVFEHGLETARAAAHCHRRDAPAVAVQIALIEHVVVGHVHRRVLTFFFIVVVVVVVTIRVEVGVLEQRLAVEAHLLVAFVGHVLLHGVQVAIALGRTPQAHVVGAELDAEELEQSGQIAHVLHVGHVEAVLARHMLVLGLHALALVRAEQARFQIDTGRLFV